MTPFHLLHLMSPLLVGYLYLGIFSELMIAGTLPNFTALDKALSPLHLVEMILKPPDEQGKQSPKAQRARCTRDGEKTKLSVVRKRKKHEVSSVKKSCYWSTIPLLCGDPSPSSGIDPSFLGLISQVLLSSRALAFTKSGAQGLL